MDISPDFGIKGSETWKIVTVCLICRSPSPVDALFKDFNCIAFPLKKSPSILIKIIP